MRDALPTLDEGLDDLVQRSDLTWSQLLLWAGQAMSPEVPLYNMVLAFDIRGPLDPVHFARAFQSTLERCDALRTVVEVADGVPHQRVQAHVDWTLEEVRLDREEDPEGAARKWLERRARRELDSSQCLFDTALLRLDETRFIWYLNQHHLITDAWATGLVYRAVSHAYELSLNDRLEEAPPLPQYADYVAHEAASTESTPFLRAAEYWQSKLDSPVEPVPLYGKTEQRTSTRTERVRVDLGPTRSEAIRMLAGSADARMLTEHLSTFIVFSALLFAFLRRVGGQDRVTIGTPAHNRPTAAFKETIGVFIEVFPFSIDLDGVDSFRDLVRIVRRESMDFIRNAQPRTSTAAGNRAYNVVLNYINADFADFAGMDMRSEWVHPGHGDLSHDLRLQVHDFDQRGTFSLHFDFSVERFDKKERLSAVDHFLRLMDGLLADPDQSLSGPSLVTDREGRDLLRRFAESTVTPRPTETVVDRFERRVLESPQETAVEFDGGSWSYGELNARANQLAARLDEQGVAGRQVAICAGRSAPAVVGMLAILKAGGAYVPLDPGHPKERLDFILGETEACAVLTTVKDKASLPATDAPVLIMDAPERGSARAENLDTRPSTSDLAYILYTSGSTGRPKGVMIEHGALASYVFWGQEQYLTGAGTAFPLFTPLTFDLTVTSIFVPLMGGGKIVVYEEDEGELDQALTRVLEDDRVDVIKLTPAHLSLLRGRDLSGSRVHTLILGGEDLKTELARAAHLDFGGKATLYNEYGPTEATVGCVLHRFDPDADRAASVPIGRPVAGARAYVLDEAHRPVPEGIIGEIAIAGPGLARGYLNRPDHTERSFGTDPLDDAGGVYFTGDLGRWRADGRLEYHGRIDRQVKLHGLRVELGEVEAALSSHPGVESCVVVTSSPNTHAEPEGNCVKCGIPSNYPGVSFDANGMCSVCVSFEGYADRALRYFGSMDELRTKLDQGRKRRTGAYDCLMLLSGGKDSSYALYQLLGMGLDVLTVTLDNGYISDGAKENVRRITKHLGVDHEYASTPAMNAIFVDSLRRHSNVCQGCFKAMYTLAVQMAVERGIPMIVTGLSKGQFFETRLPEELFWDDEVADPDRIDEMVLEARKAYHRVDDAVCQLMDTSVFERDEVFEEVEFIDFYRYCDVDLDELLAFLDEHASWVRPADTGRSTNCLINDAGIYVHQRERGYHNYALPYSWDVRLGHKERDAALEELDDDIDVADVHRILEEIGYADFMHDSDGTRLTAYYTGEPGLEREELEAHMARTLPSYMVPSSFVRLDELPLTDRGKIDVRALPQPEERREEREGYVPPSSSTERVLAEIWSHLLRMNRVGVQDNFFDLGGDSITAIQIGARARAQGLPVDPNLVFRHQTIRELAATVDVGGPGAEAEVTRDKEASDGSSEISIAASELQKASELLRRADGNLAG